MRRHLIAVACGLLGLTAVISPAAAQVATGADWPGYLNGPAHSSYNGPETAITMAMPATGQEMDLEAARAHPVRPARPARQSPRWSAARFTLARRLASSTPSASPAARSSGARPSASSRRPPAEPTDSGHGHGAGPPDGGPLTVYVAGGDGYLYALSAATGQVIWKSVIAIPSATKNNYFDWSSPTVANGNIYIGQSSQCDIPLVNGGLKEYSQSTGGLENFYQTYPGHTIQASIWSSAAYDSSGVFVTTGNGPGGDQESVVRLDPATLAKEGSWMVPKSQKVSDSDFGGSPTLFTATIGGVATPMVGACNKNGIYYAWQEDDLAAGPDWRTMWALPMRTPTRSATRRRSGPARACTSPATAPRLAAPPTPANSSRSTRPPAPTSGGPAFAPARPMVRPP